MMDETSTEQGRIDAANTRFWGDLCGTRLAGEAGIADRALDPQRRFDNARLALFPGL